MDDRELFDRQHASLREFCRICGSAAPTSTVLKLGGVIAAVVPAAPERSVVNSVVYGDADELARVLPEVAVAYEAAGVHAWTVWAPAEDAVAAAALRGAGHVLDAEPAAMAMELGSFAAPAPDMHLDLDPEPDLGTIARLNDRSYTFGGDSFERSLRHAPSLHRYVARAEGRPVSCVTGHDHDGDFSVALVATLPAARGRGLAAGLLVHALHEARERGCETTSLQATKMGRRVYERLGYRDLGALHMWERRASRGTP